MLEQQNYASFLLRLWLSDSGGNLVWQATLQNTFDNRIDRFSNLDDLMAFLHARFSLGEVSNRDCHFSLVINKP